MQQSIKYFADCQHGLRLQQQVFLSADVAAQDLNCRPGSMKGVGNQPHAGFSRFAAIRWFRDTDFQTITVQANDTGSPGFWLNKQPDDNAIRCLCQDL